MTGPVAADPLQLLTAYQGSAVVAAACRTGIADELARGPADPGTLSARLGISARGAESLTRAMVALGLATADDQGAVALSTAGATLARDHPESVAAIVDKEWFFYSAWAELPEAVGSGHARLAPWRQRLRSDPAIALAFSAALDDLGRRFGAGLPELVGPLGPGRLLDVGGGSGVHAAALAAANPGLVAEVLDLTELAPLTAERSPGVGFRTGDLSAPLLGLPEAEVVDVVLLSNVLHDLPPEGGEAVVGECVRILSPSGHLIVYDWFRDGPATRDVALFDLMMLVENDGGRTYPSATVREWMRAHGLAAGPARYDGGPIGVLVGSLP